MAILRTDGGGEFGGKAARPRIYMFDDETGVNSVCSAYGIKKEETVANESDMMGVAEAANRRALEAIRCMLYAANLPKQFWGFALVHWCQVDWYTVNSAKGSSPFKIRYGRVALAAARRPDNWPSDKFKHIESHKMFWHQYVKDKVLKLVKVPTELMPADVLTKNFLSVEKFENAAAHIVRPLPKMLQIGQV